MKIIHADELAHLPPVEFLAGTHLIARGLNVLFGASGVYKSFYMVGESMAIAQRAPVIYIAAEGVSGLNSRLDAWCQFYNRNRGQLHFVTHEVNLLDSDQTDVLIGLTKKRFTKQPAMIVFDTYARCIPGGDENAAKDTGRAIQNCAKIQRELSCAVTLVHHTNRAERGERGSGAMRGAADLMIEMSANGDSTIKVDCSKSKDGEPWPTEHYVFKQVGESGVLIPASGTNVEKLGKRQIDILEFLSMEVFIDTGAKSLQLVGGLNVSQASLYRALSDLKSRGLIRQDRTGDPYFLSENGGILLREIKRDFEFQNQPLSKTEQSDKSNESKDNKDDSQDSQVVIN